MYEYTDKNPHGNTRNLVHSDISFRIIGVLYDVSNELGHGYQEKHYQKAIALAFQQKGITYEEQVPGKIQYQQQDIGIYFLDFLVENKVVLEIKRKNNFSKTNIDQVYGYLKSTDLQLGILANFTRNGIQCKRIVNLQ